MKKFKMVLPLLATSTKEIHIQDEEGNRVGSIKRYYSRKIQRWVDIILSDKFFVNVCAMDKQENVRIRISQQFGTFKSWIRNEWKLILMHGNETYESKALSTTKIRTNPRMLYRNSLVEIEIRKDIGDKSTRFFEHSSNKMLAEVHVEGLSPDKYRNVEIKIVDELVNELEIASIYYVFRLGN